jgi:hypothetical protein
VRNCFVRTRKLIEENVRAEEESESSGVEYYISFLSK